MSEIKIPCCRPGCVRNVNPSRRPARGLENYPGCTYLCGKIAQILDQARRVSAATGDEAHWNAAEALNEALSAYLDSDARLFFAAKDVGITVGQWRVIKDGLATS